MDDFSKGVWLGDDCEYPYFPELVNLSVSTDGWLRRRRGMRGIAQRSSANAKYVFVSAKTKWSGGTTSNLKIFVQDGAALYVNDTGGGSWTQITGFPSANSFTSSAKIHMCDFNDRIYIVHPVDGVWYLDNPSDTSATNETTAVKGDKISVWQNKLWVAGDPGNLERVWWSAAGGGSWNTTDDYIDLRESNTRPNQAPGVTALGVGNGMDVVGRGGLLVFQDQSIHRIYDSTTGAYVTETFGPGAAGSEAVTSGPDGIFCASNFGIWHSTGNGRWQPIDSPIRTVWTGNMASTSTITAFTAWGRHYFSKGDSSCLVFEYVPETKGWFPHAFKNDTNYRPIVSASSHAMTGTWGSWPIPSAIVLQGTDGLAATFPQPPDFNVSGADNDDTSLATIAFRLRTPWLTEKNREKFRCRRMLMHGVFASSGALSYQKQPLSVFQDWQDDAAKVSRANAIWNNRGAIGSANAQWARVNSLGAQRALSVLLTGNSNVQESYTREILNAPTGMISNAVTNFGLKRIVFDLIPLRR